MNSDDQDTNLKNQFEDWKLARRREVPDLSPDFTERVLAEVESAESRSTRQATPRLTGVTLWIFRIALVAMTSAVVLVRLAATAAVFFTSTELE